MAGIENLNPPWSKDHPEVARDNQKKSVEARRRNTARKKTIAATVEKMLDSKVTDKKQLAIIQKSGFPMSSKPTYRDFLVASALMQTIKKGRIDDLLKIQQIIGERIENLEAGDGRLSDLIDGLMMSQDGDDA